MATYDSLAAKIERLDLRIEELASQKAYADKVRSLGCFLGIKTHTALSLIVETGDFSRFSKGTSTQHTWALPQARIPAANVSGVQG